MKKKIILFLFIFVSSCFAQYVPQFLTQPSVGYQINLGHPDAKGLIGAWLFAEGFGNTVFNLSPYDNDCILGNMDAATDWVAGRDGWALDFDGTDDELLCGTRTLITRYTMAVWVKPDESVDQYQHVVSRGGLFVDNSNFFMGYRRSGAGEHRMFVGHKTSTLYWNEIELAGNVDPSGSWHFLVGVYDGTQFLGYQDGVGPLTKDSGTDPAADPTDGGQEISIGRPSDANQEFNGQISYVGIWDRAFNSEEVRSLFIYTYAMIGQPPGRILAAAVAAAAVERRRFIRVND